jgi:cephalosporin hydroxylase
MTPLCELARKWHTDKGGDHFTGGECCHNYTPFYDKELGWRRKLVRWVLEIGVAYGSSVRMWKEYFPNATIVGLDSNAHALLHTEHRIMCIPADQNNETSLLQAIGKVAPEIPQFDLIIDDGSHEREHQRTSLKTLLPFLAMDGLYVVEDIVPTFRTAEFDGVVPDGFYSTVEWTSGGKGHMIQGPEPLFVVRRRSPCVL